MGLKKLISSILAASVVLSPAFGGGIGNFSNPSAVFAEDEVSLEPGIYAAPLFISEKENDHTPYNYSTLHFGAQAILEVGDNQSTVTIGVENWSLYDAFIPREQGYFNDECQYLPSSLFDSENSNNFTGFVYSENESIIDNNNDKYFISTSDKKYGDMVIDDTTSQNTDVAYITFNIDNYNSGFSFSAWLNTPYYGTNLSQDGTSKLDEYHWASLSFYIDLSNIEEVGSVVNEINTETEYSYECVISSPRAKVKSKTNSEKWCVHYEGAPNASHVFDSGLLVKQENGKFVGKFHVNADGYTTTGVPTYYSSFQLLNNVNHPIVGQTSNSLNDWDLLMTGSFTDIEPDSDGYIQIEYNNWKEALIGKPFFFDWGSTTDKTIYFVYPCLKVVANEDFVISDETEGSGIYIQTNTAFYPKTTKLKVEKNAEVYQKVDGESIPASYYWTSSLYKSATWYTLYLTDENDNLIDDSKNSVNICIPLHVKDEEVIYVLTSSGSTKTTSEKANANYDSGVWIVSSDGCDSELKGPAINGLTVAYLNPAEAANIHDISEDGLYSAEAYFLHRNNKGTRSMADKALVKDVFIEIKDGKRKMYFKAGTAAEGAYIGDLFCNNVNESGAVYPESISYTDFECVNGELVPNAEYDAITEFGNVKGGILTLMDECYLEDENAYSVAVIAPIMQCLSGTPVPYDQIVKDDTPVWLKFINLKKCDDSVTLDTILNEGYGYHSSALLRKIKQAELYNGNKYSAETFASLTSAIETAQDVYEQSFDDAASASHAYEAQITALDEAIANLKEPEVTVSGYQASVADDVTLNYVLNIPEALEDKADSGKLMATITYADGTTKEIAVQVEDEYFVPVSVAPKEIANEISVTIGDGTFTYSVKEYLESVVNSETATDSEKAVAKSLLNYAGCAQDYFKAKNADANAYLSDTKANENVDSTLADITDDAVKAFDAPTLGDNVSFYGASLTCDYDTSIKMYFKVTDDIANHTFTANGETVEAVEAADGIYCITYSGISAKNLATAYTFSVDGTNFTYGAYNYIYAALNATEVQSGALTELQNMVKAIYYYAEAAKLA
mgnify:CR=1 FL=1